MYVANDHGGGVWFVRACVRACVRVCVCVRARVRVVCVCVCVCVCAGRGCHSQVSIRVEPSARRVGVAGRFAHGDGDVARLAAVPNLITRHAVRVRAGMVRERGRASCVVSKGREWCVSCVWVCMNEQVVNKHAPR
jgi:hypothetical protein